MSTLTALFATCKEIVMQTFYFVSMDYGFIQYACVRAQNIEKALAYIAQTSSPRDQMWVNVAEDEYVNLRNAEECED